MSINSCTDKPYLYVNEPHRWILTCPLPPPPHNLAGVFQYGSIKQLYLQCRWLDPAPEVDCKLTFSSSPVIIPIRGGTLVSVIIHTLLHWLCLWFFQPPDSFFIQFWNLNSSNGCNFSFVPKSLKCMHLVVSISTYLSNFVFTVLAHHLITVNVVF